MKAHELGRRLLEGPDLPVVAFAYGDIVTVEVDVDGLVAEELLLWDSVAGRSKRVPVLLIRPGQ